MTASRCRYLEGLIEMNALDLREPPTQGNFKASSHLGSRTSEHQYDNVRPHPECQALLDAVRMTHSAPLTERLIEAQTHNSEREGYPFFVFRSIRADGTDETKWILLETLKFVMDRLARSEKGERWHWVAVHIETYESFIRDSGDDFAIAELDRLTEDLRRRSNYSAIQKWVKDYIAT